MRVILMSSVRAMQNPLLLKEGWREATGWFLFFKATTPPRFALLPLLQKGINILDSSMNLLSLQLSSAAERRKSIATAEGRGFCYDPTIAPTGAKESFAALRLAR